MKSILFLAALIVTSSKISYSTEIGEGTKVIVDNEGNPQLLEREGLKNTNPGQELVNKGEIFVEGTHPSHNSNLAAIRATDKSHVKNIGIINIESYGGGMGIVADDSTVENIGTMKIEGENNIGIYGGNGSNIENSGEIDITEYSRNVAAMESHGGRSTNSGKIIVGGSMSQGMVGFSDANQKNTGEITVSGTNSAAIEGKGDSKSFNEGIIRSDAYQGRGMISYEGSQLENSGEIIMEGYRNYGIVSDNKSGNPSLNNAVNNGTIHMKGDFGVGLTGIGINEVQNNGTILMEGSEGTAVTYTNVNEVKNDGEIIIKGNGNWAFAVDEVKDSEVKSVGKVSIIDSTNSGAIEVKNNIQKGIVEGDVDVKNGSGIAVISVENTGEAINRGNINIVDGSSNFGIHSEDGKKTINEKLISLGGKGGAAIYNPGGEFIQNKGEIVIKGEGQTGIYYENEDAGLINTGEIVVKGNGNQAFDVNPDDNTVVKSVGNVRIDEEGSNSMAAYARYNIKKAINEGSIKIHGKNSSGLVGLDGTTLVNTGTIFVDTEESYGIQAINDAKVINEGHISNTAEDGVAIYMGVEDSELYMDTKSSVRGRVYSAGGVGTFYGTNTDNSSDIHKLNYDLVNFSHLDLKEGAFEIGNNIVLKAPEKDTLKEDHRSTADYEGTLLISEGSELTMQVGVNDGLSSTIHAKELKIDGKLNYMPIDRVYVTEADEIVIPNIFTEEEITGVSDESVGVINVVEGWTGDYRLSSDKTDLSLVLKRSEEGKYLPDSYYDGVFNYPHSYLDIKNVNEVAHTTDSFKAIDKIHNAEIPYLFQMEAVGGSGNFDGGDGKGKFDYDRYGSSVKFHHKISEDVLYELGFSFIDTSLKYRHSSKESMESYILNGSLVRRIDEFKVGGYLATSINTHDLKRGVTGKDIGLEADYDSYVSKGGVSLGHEYRSNKNTVYNSYIDLGVVYQHTPGYKEDGDYYYAMDIDKNETLTPVLNLGVEQIKRNKNIRTKLGGRVNYYFGDPMESREGYYVFKPDVKYDVEPVDMPAITFAFDLGIEADLSDRFSVFLNGGAEVGRDLWEASGKVGMTYEF
ncbi:autotransporter outer membrane beta-barrel domain-containing protein [Propionigenium maris]|nr:autotransporter outer membrane beta-barrel domain-containing protein [Propionigenium maris]